MANCLIWYLLGGEGGGGWDGTGEIRHLKGPQGYEICVYCLMGRGGGYIGFRTYLNIPRILRHPLIQRGDTLLREIQRKLSLK